MHVDLELEATADPDLGRLSIVAWCDSHSRSIGSCQATRQPAAWSLELVVDRRQDRLVAGIPLVRRALEEVGRSGGGIVNLWVSGPGTDDDALAAAVGLAAGRELVQMRRPLPVEQARFMGVRSIKVRPFRLGEDEARWLEVNNRAFARHPEQGKWDAATLKARLAEPWFDPAGLLLHEIDSALAGFCWTKVHAEHTPPMGEIFVIAVDPTFGGQGLGRELTLAGLDHLADRGLGVGMLYVDTTNAPALRMYERLGFTVDHLHRAYTATVPPR